MSRVGWGRWPGEGGTKSVFAEKDADRTVCLRVAGSQWSVGRMALGRADLSRISPEEP